MEIQADKANNHQSDIDSDPNAFQRIGTELKSTIFAMVSLLIKEQEVSVYFAAFIPIFEFLQVMGYAFNIRVYKVWDFDDIAKVLHDILEHLRLVPYFESTTFSVYSIIFYLILGVLMFLSLGLAYIYYMSSRRRPAFSWPVQAIRIILTFMSSLLFLPICEYILSMFACVKDVDGVLVHSIFTETQCWTKIHLANGIFAILGSLVFLVLTAVTTLIFFEARPMANNFNARTDSRPLLIFNIYKFCLVLLFLYLRDREYQVSQIAFLLVGSTVVFAKFQFQNPFYNEVIMKAWSTMAAINLWTALMLVFAKIMENSNFNETIFVWMLVIPLVIFVNLNNTDKRMPYFLINTSKFQSGYEVVNHISYLLKLLSIQNTNKNASTMLDGYLEIHKQDCFNEQCPCRNKNKVINNNRITRNLLISDDNLSEKEAIIMYLIYQIYELGVKSFPNSTPLRIAYAFFLLDKMSSKQQALQVLTEAEQRHPSADQEFIVFRYKKIIEDEIAESQHDQQQGDGGLDIGSESSFQNHLRLCQANIEKSALLHMEFWSQLSEDQPDLAKVGEIGAKISASVKAVEDQWNKLVKINPNNAKAMRLFGKFLIEIIHNKERGEELLDRASNLANLGSNKKNMGFMMGNKDFGDEALPTVVISGEQDRFGVITNINLAAASLFSFNKNELLNRKLTTLMPPLYAKYHDSFLERYLQTNESTVIGKNKERLAFGKTKSNYAFPFFYNVKAIPSMMQGVQFVATFRVEKKLRNTAYIITYPDGTIDSISSSCISLLKIDKALLQKRPKIQDFVQNILSDRHLLFTSTANGTKASAQINFTYPEESEYLFEGEEPTTQLTCHLYDLVFLNGRENAGFQFRFEKTMDKTSTQLNLPAKLSNFQFKFDPQKSLYTGEYIADFTSASQETPEYNDVLQMINVPSVAEAEPLSASGQPKKSKNTEKTGTEDDGFSFMRRTEYGIGVKTYRLVRGEIADIEDDKSEDNDEDGDNEKDMFSGPKRKENSSLVVHNQSSEDNLEEEGSTADFGNMAKSRKVLISVINDRTPPVNVKRLNWAIHVLALILIALSIWDYVNILDKMNKLSDNIDNIGDSRTLVAEMMTALSNVRDLYLMKRGLFASVTSMTETTLKTQLETALDAAKALKEKLEQDKSSLWPEHVSLYNDPVVSMANYQASPSMTGLIQATEDIITKGLNLAETDLNLITDTNPDYYFVTYNLFNNYYLALLNSSDLYVQEFFSSSDGSSIAFTLIMVLSIVALVIFMLALVPIILSVTRAEDQVLRLFLDIPDKTVKSLYSKCENFVSNLQVGEEEELASEMDEEEMDRITEEQEAQGWLVRKRRKKFKNTRRSHTSFFLAYFVLGALVETPFMYNYFASDNLLQGVAQIGIEFNSTSYAELFYSFSNNAQRQLFIDATLPILNKASVEVATSDIDLMRLLNSDILSNNSVNIEKHTTAYNTIFFTMFYGNPCTLLTASVASSTCQSFADQTVPKGMSLLLVRHFENMNLLLDTYLDLYYSGAAWPFSTSYIVPNIDSNTTNNEILSLMVVPRAQEIATTQSVYIHNVFRMLISSFEDNLKDDFDSFRTIRLLIFTFFLVLVGVIYVFIWVPLMSRMSNKIWKTKSMLNMIPIAIIVKIRSIRTYLRNSLNENHLHNY